MVAVKVTSPPSQMVVASAATATTGEALTNTSKVADNTSHPGAPDTNTLYVYGVVDAG